MDVASKLVWRENTYKSLGLLSPPFAWVKLVTCNTKQVSCGEKNLEDYRAKTSNSRPRRDDGHFVTPR